MTDIIEQRENELATIPKDTGAIQTHNTGQPLSWNDNNVEITIPSFWQSAGEIFNINGFQPEQRRISFLTLISMNSAAWGSPLAVALIDDDGSRAISVLDTCLKMTPNNSIVEFSNLDQKVLLQNGNNLKDKGIVGFNVAGSKKTIPDLLNLMSRSLLTSQSSHGVREQRGNQPTSFEGPISWVVMTSSNNEILSSPLIIKLPVFLDTTTLKTHLQASVEMGQSQPNCHFRELCACVQKTLSRLSARRVEVPFKDELIASMNSNIPNLTEKFENLVRLLRSIVIINNPPPITQQEVSYKYLGLDYSLEDANAPPLVATKVDYYFLWVLMNGVMPGGDDLFTSNQKRIFQVILNRCLNSLENKFLTETDKNSEAAKLKIISHPDNCHYHYEKADIRQAVNRDGGEILTVGKFENELKELINNQIITPYKISTNKVNYYVNVLTLNSGFELIHPSEIQDPVSNGNPVQVVNPLTGQNEMI